MSIKELVKPFIPESLLQYRRDIITKHVINSHKKMSRAEIEAWLGHCYQQRIGAELNLQDPKRYTEKVQWCKLNAMTSTKSMLADKYAVRKWVADTIGEKYLVPLIGVWDSPDEIDFESLPNSFVLKTTQGSGTNIIVTNKGDLNINRSKRLLRRWLAFDYGWIGFERHYMRIQPKVICEQFLSNGDGGEINDYKVLCFDGEPKYIWVDLDRHSRHSRVVFDLEWNVQPWNQYHYPEALLIPEKPVVLDEMIVTAKKLCADFAHVRVDFFIVNDRLFFGEMTFTNGGGFEEIRPDEWDYRLGDLWSLSDEELSDFPIE